MITLTTVVYIHEADLLCLRLAENGIQAFIPDQHLATIQPLYSNAMGGIRIQVSEADLEKAQAILQQMQAPTAQKPGCLSCQAEIPAGQDHCPKCGWSYKE